MGGGVAAGVVVAAAAVAAAGLAAGQFTPVTTWRVDDTDGFVALPAGWTCQRVIEDVDADELTDLMFGEAFYEQGNKTYVPMHMHFSHPAFTGTWEPTARVWASNNDPKDRFQSRFFTPTQVIGLDAAFGNTTVNGTETVLFAVLDINRELTAGTGFFEINLTRGNDERVGCIFYEKPLPQFPPVFGLVLAGMLMASVWACVLWGIGTCFERNMETEIREQMAKKISLEEDEAAMNEHAGKKKKK